MDVSGADTPLFDFGSASAHWSRPEPVEPTGLLSHGIKPHRQHESAACVYAPSRCFRVEFSSKSFHDFPSLFLLNVTRLGRGVPFLSSGLEVEQDRKSHKVKGHAAEEEQTVCCS